MSTLAQTSPAPRGDSRRIGFAAFIGTTIEWYDFYIYSTASALIFSHAFFPPSKDAFSGLLGAFAAYGVGFFARPLGGIIAGHFGDRIGRKRVLVYSLILMGIATLLTGLLPTYATIGPWATALLVTLRLLQGIAPGAAWFAEQFPVEVRYSGVSLGYQIGTLISGGLTPLIATYLYAAGGGTPWLICGFISFYAILSLVAALAARDPVRTDEARRAVSPVRDRNIADIA